MRAFNLLIIFNLLLLTVFAHDAEAQAPEVSVEEQCFTLLLENMKETSLMETEVDYLSELSYSELESEFSKKYKTLTSFGSDISLDEARFAARFYSFGEQTGYIHPPQSIFPDSLKSEAWSTTTRQNILGEEYVIDDAGTEHFIGCFFVRLSADDLLSVTAEKYLGDGPGLSLLKVSTDGAYNAWYANIPSFDRAMLPLVTWEKMFIYPKATKNTFFDKYTVAEAYPAVRVGNFAFLGPVEPTQSVAEVVDLKEEIELLTSSANVPAEAVEAAPVFPLAPYLDAIQNKFPEFAKHLSIRGVVKYDTFKEIIANPNQNPELAKFFDVAFVRSELSSYFYMKSMPVPGVDNSSNPELERLLLLVQNGDWTVKKIKEGGSLDTLVYEPMETEVVASPPASTSSSQPNLSSVQRYLLGIIVAVVLFIIALLLWGLRKKVI